MTLVRITAEQRTAIPSFQDLVLIVRSCDLLILGTSLDRHIDRVVSHLPSSCRCFRFDIDRFPVETELSARVFEGGLSLNAMCGHERESLNIRLHDARVVWFRRIGMPQLNSAIVDKAHRAFALNETEQMLSGISALLSDKFWVSDYWSTKRACNKIYQLVIAKQVGFNVPRTIVTNSPSEAKLYYDDNKQIVYKTLASPSIVYNDRRTLIYSRLLSDGDMTCVDSVRYCPCQFQEYIDKSYEVRATYIGGRIFAAMIRSQDRAATRVDWRASMNAEMYSVCDLPQDIEVKICEFMKQIGLKYGALDLIVTPDDEYIFLEVNPHGAWGWIESATSLPISKSLCEYLLEHI